MKNMEWRPIDELNIKGMTMFLVIGVFDQFDQNDKYKYITDPYCVWKEGDDFMRWPHDKKPTHFCYIPEFK